MKVQQYKYGIPKSTIQRLVKEVRGKFSGEQVATPEELRAEVGHIAIEHELLRKGPAMIFTVEEIVLQPQCVNTGYSRAGIRRLAGDWAKELGATSAVCGKQWLLGFLRRHPRISFYKTSKVDVKRALKADNDIYGKWFKFVQEKFDEHNGGVVPHASRVS